MSVSYFNTNEYELMNKDNIVATVSCTRDEFNDLYFEIHHIFSELPIGFKTFKDWSENRGQEGCEAYCRAGADYSAAPRAELRHPRAGQKERAHGLHDGEVHHPR